MPIYTRNATFWQCYLDFAHDLAPKLKQKLDLYTRVLKNCNNVSEFWTGYLILLEKDEQLENFESLKEICEQAIQQQA